MLTPERHRFILSLLQEQKVATVQELSAATETSESTIRRDLVQLEQEGKLTRFHGGAQWREPSVKSEETTIAQRLSQHEAEKRAIARFAASLVKSGDCLFLDAGTTTFYMIDDLPQGAIVVTNGLTHIERLLERNIKTYLIGGSVKGMTKALIGKGAVESLKNYRFDKCFLGINGVHLEHGLSTPDPEEAFVKQTAANASTEVFVLADHSKLGKTTFSFVCEMEDVTLITNDVNDQQQLDPYKKKTKVEVVTP